MAKVLFQIGAAKTPKKRCLVKAYVNDVEVSWSDGASGLWLTSHKDRQWRGLTWYLCDLDLNEKDVLRIDVKSFLAGIGLDLENTFEAFFSVSDDAEVLEISRKSVGHPGYPLVKGRLIELGCVSEEDKRLAEIEQFINEGF